MIIEPLFTKSLFRTDDRGFLNKVLHKENKEAFIGDSCIEEIFSTFSDQMGTIRGMHLQTSPKNTIKIVWVTYGAVLDVIVDLRIGLSYGKCTSFNLSAENSYLAIVPQGFGHGFQTLQPNTVVNYATNYKYKPEWDTGVRWDSLDFKWPLAPKNVSMRDASLISIEDYSK